MRASGLQQRPGPDSVPTVPGACAEPVVEPQAWDDRLELGTLPARVCCRTEDGYFVQVEMLDLTGLPARLDWSRGFNRSKVCAC